MSISQNIARLNADGSTDVSFDPGAGLDEAGRAVAVLASGMVLAGGDFTVASAEMRGKLAVYHADGSLDTRVVDADERVNFFVPQTDGRVLVGGMFTELGGEVRGGLARLEEDLNVDAIFRPAFDGGVRAAAVQGNGRVVVAGGFTAVGPTLRGGLARLHNDPAETWLRVVNESTVVWRRSGSCAEGERVSFELDTGGGYGPLGGSVTRVLDEWQVTGLTLSGSGSIRARVYPGDGHSQGVAEEVHGFNFVPVLQVEVDEVRLGTLATVDYGRVQIGKAVQKSFRVSNVGLTELSFAATGATLAGTNANQWSFLDPDSVLAPGAAAVFVLTFTPTSAGGKVAKLSLHTDDAGTPYEVNVTGMGVPGPGSVDGDFQVTLGGGETAVNALCPLADGVMAGGVFTSVNGQNRKGYAQLSETGGLLVQAGAGANGAIQAMAQLPDGPWMVGGAFTTVNGVARQRLARLSADRTVDKSFKVNANGTVHCLLVQEDGGVIVGGDFTTLDGATRNGLGRLTRAGTLDARWVRNVGPVMSLATQADGKIYVAGRFPGGVMRLNANGTMDPGFNANLVAGQFVPCVAVDAEGRVLYTVRTAASPPALKRALATGAEDAGFSSELAVSSVVVQADGMILAGKSNAVERVDGSGVTDPTFAGEALGSALVVRVALSPLGGIYAGGSVLKRLVNDLEGAGSVLTVESPTAVHWLRGGTLPEAQYVIFELSEDGGSTWVRLGKGERMAGGWKLVTRLPKSGQVRGRAYVGTSHGSGLFHDEVAVFSGLAVPDVQVEFPSGMALSHGGELVFPGTLPGQNLSLTLTIRNTGLAALSDLVLSSADAEWMVMSLGLTTLAVNQTTTAVVRFSPVKTGVKTGTLRLTSNVAGAKNPYVLGLRGAGTALPKATTNGETNVASTTVTLNGRVTPNHDTATAFFQYQKTSETAWTTVGSREVGGFEVVLCSFNASGLTPATNYRYRLVVYNGVNTAAAPVYGANNLFTTLP